MVEADTAAEAWAAAASERGWPLTETVTSVATEPPAAMPVSRPGRPAYSTDFCPQLSTFAREEDGREQVTPCGSPLTVVADGAGIIESVCGAGHRYATCACQEPDCTGWKAISVGAHYLGSSPDHRVLLDRWCRRGGWYWGGGLASGLTLGIEGVAVADHGPWMVARRVGETVHPG